MPTSDFAETSEWNPGSDAAALNPSDPTYTQHSQATRVDSGFNDTPLDSEFELTSSDVDQHRVNRPDLNIGKLLKLAVDGQGEVLKLTKLIGIGGMGKVYEATSLDNPSKKTVAVKLAKRTKNDEKTQKRLSLESDILRSLEHDHIVRFVGNGTTDNNSGFIVMERIVGMNVVEFVNRNQWSLENRLELFAKICDAVAHCHENGILHRDIKPGNVLVNEITAEPVLIDFGIAKQISSSRPMTAIKSAATKPSNKTDGQLIGTIQYMSPEQAMQDEVRIDHRSDVYSLGALLFEMLTGAPLIEREALEQQNLEDIVSTIASRRETLSLKEVSNSESDNPQLLSCVEWILEKAIQNDPVERYADASQFKQDLQFAMDDPDSFIDQRKTRLDKSTKTVCRAQQLGRWTRNHLWQAISLCVLVALGATFAMSPFADCSSAKNSPDKAGIVEFEKNLLCDYEERVFQFECDEVPEPNFQRVNVDRFYVERAANQSFAIRGRKLNAELCSEKVRRQKKLLVPKTKIRWMTEGKPCYSIELARELPDAAQKQAIIQVQHVVERLDEPSMREVRSLIRRIPRQTLHHCLLHIEEQEIPVEDTTEF